jgi:hypothetical protein
MKLIENDYVLIQDLVSRPNEPLTSAPYALQVVKDLMVRFSRDRLNTTMPLYFHRHPVDTVHEQGTWPVTTLPIDRSDLKGSPRIALSEPPRKRPTRP